MKAETGAMRLQPKDAHDCWVSLEVSRALTTLGSLTESSTYTQSTNSILTLLDVYSFSELI